MSQRLRLNPELLCKAYSMGYFPMPDPKTQEIVFLRPDPRAIFPLDGFHLSRSLRRSMKRRPFFYSTNQAFLEVMQGCAARDETWITDDFFEGYCELSGRGLAHSVEVWENDELVGGLYGVVLGRAFFAESKFHTKTDASKIALFVLVELLKRFDYQLLEVQFMTPHLETLGATSVSDERYQTLLSRALKSHLPFRTVEKTPLTQLPLPAE